MIWREVANVEIENGAIQVRKVWGDSAPRHDLGWMLNLSFKNHDGRGDGNVLREPVATDVFVYLTRGQLSELTRKLAGQAAEDAASAVWCVGFRSLLEERSAAMAKVEAEYAARQEELNAPIARAHDELDAAMDAVLAKAAELDAHMAEGDA